MATLETTMVSTLLEWYDEKTLTPNPEFQRRPVWPMAAKSYFVDSIIRGRPTPNIYIRSKVDLTNRKTIREVVDGQQRIRTLCDRSIRMFSINPFVILINIPIDRLPFFGAFVTNLYSV